MEGGRDVRGGRDGGDNKVCVCIQVSCVFEDEDHTTRPATSQRNRQAHDIHMTCKWHFHGCSIARPFLLKRHIIFPQNLKFLKTMRHFLTILKCFSNGP